MYFAIQLATLDRLISDWGDLNTPHVRGAAIFFSLPGKLFFEILIVMVMFGAFYWFIGRQVCNRIGRGV